MRGGPGRGPGPAPGPTRSDAWLRRQPGGGWTLDVEQGGLRHRQTCVDLPEVARRVAAHPNLDDLHVWSEGQAAFVELPRASLAPLLTEPARSGPAGHCDGGVGDA